MKRVSCSAALFILLVLSSLELFAQKCPKVGGLSVSAVGEQTATLNWDGADEHISYQVDVKHGQHTPPFQYSENTSNTSIDISNLMPGSNYRFRVKAKCDKGSSGASQWFSFSTNGDASDTTGVDNGDDGDNGNGTGPCPKPSNLAVLEVTDTSVFLSWLGNKENISYQVDVSHKQHTSIFKLSEMTPDTFLMVSGLEAGGNYHFRVKAKCDKNSSGSSSWINFTTTGGEDSTFNNCPKPTNLSVLEVTESTALLSWISKDTVEEFELDVKSGSQTPSFSLHTTLPDTFYLVEGLSPEGNYQFRVKAVCDTGSTSGSSDWSKFRTLAAPDSMDLDSLPGLDNGSDSSSIQFSTFPNPVDEVLTVDLLETDGDLMPEAFIQIADLEGKVVYRKSIDQRDIQKVRIPVDVLVPGLYKVSIIAGKKVTSKSVMIHH